MNISTLPVLPTLDLSKPNFVGVISSLEDIAYVTNLHPQVDAFELRMDQLFAHKEEVNVHIQESLHPTPIILSVRSIDEGGATPLPDELRLDLYKEFLPLVQAVDIEITSLEAMRDILTILGDNPKERKIKLIASHHDFEETPSEVRLAKKIGETAVIRPDIIKVAYKIQHPRDFSVLTEFFIKEHPFKKSILGMGDEYGKISRLYFAKLGVVLNYGFITRPQVNGQWPAELLRSTVAEL